MLEAIFALMAYGYTSEYSVLIYEDFYFLFIQTILVIYHEKKYSVAIVHLGESSFLPALIESTNF